MSGAPAGENGLSSEDTKGLLKNAGIIELAAEPVPIASAAPPISPWPATGGEAAVELTWPLMQLVTNTAIRALQNLLDANVPSKDLVRAEASGAGGKPGLAINEPTPFTLLEWEGEMNMLEGDEVPRCDDYDNRS